MAVTLHAVDLEQACLELFICTRQPGKLRISKQACAMRYLMAQAGKITIPEDELGMARKAGLAICQDCPEGRIRAKGSK